MVTETPEDLLVVRRRVLDWLCTYAADQGVALPEWLVTDLRGRVVVGKAEEIDIESNPVKGLFLVPMLTVEDHTELLAEAMGLPEEGPNAEFWHTVVEIVHRMWTSEADAREKE